MECKFKNIETIEGLMEKTSSELYGCGCERCQPVAEKKELAELRAEKQTQLAQQAAREEERKRIEKLESDVKGFEQILESVRQEEREKLMKEKGLDQKGFLNNPLFHKWMNNQYIAPQAKNVYSNTQFGREQLSPEMKNFLHYCKTGDFLYKDLTTNPETNGAGSFVPEEFYNQVVKERDKVSVLRQIAPDVIPMNSDSIKVPVEADPGTDGTFRDQSTSMADESPTLDDITLSPKDWTNMVKVHRSMLEDSGVPLADYLSRLFGRRLAKFENNKLINGAGTAGDVEGLNAVTARMVDAALNTVTSAGETVRTLYFSLAKEYRNNAVWLMNGAKLSQLVQYLNEGNLSWMVSYRDGVPAALLGRPVYEIDNIPPEDVDGDTTTDEGESKIFFGDPMYIKVGDRAGLSVLRSTERYFEERKVAFAAERPI